VAGIDFSESLISKAKIVLPNGNFEVAEATKFKIKEYDFILSNSVFQYFDVEYAEKVIKRMQESIKKKGAILNLDVPDIETKNILEEIRRVNLPPGKYQNSTNQYYHTYYSKTWFEQLAFRINMNLQIFSSFIPNYAQKKYRFCVLLHTNS
jgi:trans-aconitate methyltransferase